MSHFHSETSRSLRTYFRTACAFMIAEALFHASGTRMAGVELYWPESAVAFSYFLMILWATACAWMAVVFGIVSTDVVKYREFIRPLAIMHLVHAGVLVFLSSILWPIHMPVPALYGWHQYFPQQLLVEASILVSGGIFLLNHHAYRDI